MYGHSEPLWRGHVQRILLHFLNKSRFIFTCDFYLLNPSDYTTKKKLICFSVGKWQVGAAVYWNMHTYMCQYCGIGLRPLLKDKIGHVFFQFFPPVAPILFCTFQMVLHHFWQDPQHHWLKCSINHIKASATCYKWL